MNLKKKYFNYINVLTNYNSTSLTIYIILAKSMKYLEFLYEYL